MDFSVVCRTCLKSGKKNYLHPIFKPEDDYENVFHDVYESTGVQIRHNDNLPQNICTICIKKIQNILSFRKKCKEAESELLIYTQNNKQIDADFVSTEIDENIPISAVNLNVFQTDENKEIENKIIITEFVDILDLKNELDVDSDGQLYEASSKSYLKGAKDENNKKITKNNNFLIQKNNFKNISTKNLTLEANNIATVPFKGNAIPKTNNFETIINENTTADTKMVEEIHEQTNEFVRPENTDLKNTYFNYTEMNSTYLNNTELNNTELINKELNNTELINTELNNTDLNSADFNNIDSNDSNQNEHEVIENPYTILDPKSKNSKVICKLCDTELSIRSMVAHLERKHPGTDRRKIQCQYCEKYITKARMTRHVMKMHYVDDGVLKCRNCKTEFDKKELLVEHISSCTAKKKKRINVSGRKIVECDVCSKKMQKASLRMHIAITHSGLKPVCEFCGKSFGNKFRLNEHYRAKHGFEKFQCSYCDFRSAGITAMRNHERRHRGEKPFVCGTCDAKFHAAYLLNQHKNSHRTEKLVKCDLCPASFKANNSLHMHKQTCHSKSTYRCTLCGRAYKCRHYALKHVKASHNHVGPPPVVVVNVTGVSTSDARDSVF